MVLMLGLTQSFAPGSIKVMLVDDSAIIRGLIARILAEDPAIAVVAQAANGERALAELDRVTPDVIVLDVEMPVMDGLTALPAILHKAPRARVVMCSSLTQHGGRVTIQALQAGAADYITKPSAAAELSGAGSFRRDLIDKIKSLGTRRQPALRPPAAKRLVAAVLPAAGAVDVLAIGSSTGGPQALFAIFALFKGRQLRLPILVTQHMPAAFTGILAETMARLSGCPAAEGQMAEIVRPGRGLCRSGGKHMLVERQGGGGVIRLSDEPPENYCKPAVDPMFRSVSACYGSRVMAVVLTGMGVDGAKGGRLSPGRAACSTPRTKRPASCGECPAPRPTRAAARPCCPFPISVR